MHAEGGPGKKQQVTSGGEPTEEETLVQGVKHMAMASLAKPPAPAVGKMGDVSMDAGARVSGLDSYDGSSDASLAAQEHTQDHSLSIQERLRAAKMRSGHPERRTSLRSPGASRDIAKQRKIKKAVSPESIAQSFRTMQQVGVCGANAPEGHVQDVLMQDQDGAKEQDLMEGKLTATASNLMGAQDEPHQEP